MPILENNGKFPEPPPRKNRPHDYSDYPKRVEPVRLDPFANFVKIRHSTENMRESQTENQRTEDGNELEGGHLQGNRAMM